jgi:MFS family permease
MGTLAPRTAYRVPRTATSIYTRLAARRVMGQAESEPTEEIHVTIEQEEHPIAGATTTATQTRQRGPLTPLRSRNFSLLFWGQLISVLGDQAYGLALPWTVLIITGDPRQMAIVLAAEALPRVLFLLIGGALADRLSPRLVMLVADLGRAAVVGALGITLVAGLQGVGSGLFAPGSLALLPRVLDADDLPAANGLMQVTQFLSLTLGPVLGGVATAAQAIIAFLADAASFLISALTLFGIRLPTRHATPAPVAGAADGAVGSGVSGQKSGMLAEIGAGIGYAFRQPLLRTTMSVTVLANFGLSGAFGVALIVLINSLTHSALALGLVTATLGVGGILGGLQAAILGWLRRRGIVALVLWAFMALAIAAVPIAAGQTIQIPFGLDLSTLSAQLGIDTLGPGGRIGLIAALLGIVGFILSIGDTMILTIMQQRIAPEYMARVFSVQFVAGGITQPLSLVAAGYLAATYGAGITFLAAGVVLLLAIVIGFSSRELRRV